jgi:hypothetical protein
MNKLSCLDGYIKVGRGRRALLYTEYTFKELLRTEVSHLLMSLEDCIVHKDDSLCKCNPAQILGHLF